MIFLKMLGGGFLSFQTIVSYLLKNIFFSFYDTLGLHNAQCEHENFIVRLFSFSLIGDVKQWYNNLHIKSIKTWETLENAFLKKWEVRKDGKLLLSQFHHIKRKGEEPINEFNARFDALVKYFL